jgi:hypothetical protein
MRYDHDELAEPLLDGNKGKPPVEIFETSMNIDSLLDNLKYRFENFLRAECTIVHCKLNHYIQCQNKYYKVEITSNEINDVVIFAGRVKI